MRAIVAADLNWGIGKKGGLMFSLPADMKFFREQTLGKVVVMGSKTLDSFPGGAPLKKRTNIVLTRGEPREGCITVKNIQELLEVVKGYDKDDVFVIGGGEIYRLLLPYCEEALVTKVEADGGADVFFPNLDAMPEWERAVVSSPILTGEYKIRFLTYRNRALKNNVGLNKAG